MKPLAIDLFCGLGGWSEGLLAENWRVVGFDIEQHVYGEHRYPAQLVIQDVLTLHGSQFKDAALIVASPPCTAYSYRAMPWSRAKALPPPDNTLFEACFRIQREANEANGCDLAGNCIECDGTGNMYGHDEDGDFLECDYCTGAGCKRYIPMVVENVRGAQKWVGQARWNYGSFYLWGDVPALMPPTLKASGKVPGFRFDGSGKSFQTASVAQTGVKAPGMNWSDPTKRGQDFTRLVGKHATEGVEGVPHRTKGHWTNPAEHDGVKHHGSGDVWFDTGPAALSSKSPGRKFASAMIAKIPEPLSRHIARTFKPLQAAA